MKPLLVGESNPYGSDPEDALVPYPEGCAGWRLCVPILQMSRAYYLRTFDRANLLEGMMWSIPRAREAARELTAAAVGKGQDLILLGARVAKAFGVRYEPFQLFKFDHFRVVRVLVLPHPSGRCRLWNRPGMFERARVTVEHFLKEEG